MEKYPKCPFYKTHSMKNKKSATITCENLEMNLGFQVFNQLVFKSHAEVRNYIEIFCEDMYQTCPYYKAIYKKNYEEDMKR